MALMALTNRRQSAEAFQRLRNTFQRGATRLRRNVGWQGGGGSFDVFWRPHDGYWSLLHANVTENRYWCCFGVEDPTAYDNLTITCEINPPKSGLDLRTAGMFAVAGGGHVYFTHSGNRRRPTGDRPNISSWSTSAAAME